MRILHFVPDIGIANGVMSVVLNYFKAMPEDIKFDFMYFKEREQDRRADIEKLGGRVFHMNTPGLKSFFSSELDNFFKEHESEYSAVHIHTPYMACLIAPKAKKHGVKKVAVHCHSTLFSLNKGNQTRNRILNIPTKLLADKLFACGRQAGEFWYGKRAGFTVLTNAIDCEKYRYDVCERRKKRAELGITENQFVVGHVGVTIPPLKNHPFLLEVFAQIKKENPDSVLLMAGAEPTDELQKLASQLGITEDIRFLGRRDDIPALLSAVDVFVFPSKREGLPVSVIEAQTAGLPVIMSDSITDEVCITKEIAMLSIEADPSEWAKKALSVPKIERQDICDLMKKSGWDIYSAANNLETFYREGEQ